MATVSRNWVVMAIRKQVATASRKQVAMASRKQGVTVTSPSIYGRIVHHTGFLLID